jgi:hypothetical protein
MSVTNGMNNYTLHIVSNSEMFIPENELIINTRPRIDWEINRRPNVITPTSVIFSDPSDIPDASLRMYTRSYIPEIIPQIIPEIIRFQHHFNEGSDSESLPELIDVSNPQIVDQSFSNEYLESFNDFSNEYLDLINNDDDDGNIYFSETSHIETQIQELNISEEDRNCCICMETKDKIEICQINCGHKFCGECISHHIERIHTNSVCPLCRTDIKILTRQY